jgi:hypothetical protein
VGLSWFVNPQVSLGLRVDRFESTSEDGTRSYDENRAYLGITYARRGS